MMSGTKNAEDPRRAAVSLRELASEVEAVFSEWGVSINLETGEIHPYPEDDYIDWDGPPLEQYYEPPWVPVEIMDADREWRIMRDFAYSREDDGQCERLSRAVDGPKPFRNVRDAVYRLGIQDDWFAYRHDRVVEYARDWLQFMKIDFDDDATK